MISAPLTPKTYERVNVLFVPDLRAEASQLLEQKCGNNLPGLESLNSQELERVRFAALKISHGDLDMLKMAIDLANLDWRDLLAQAGFANDIKVHESWLQQ